MENKGARLTAESLKEVMARHTVRFKNTGVEGAWLHVVIGSTGSLPVYDR
jgi:hypothetical protein